MSEDYCTYEDVVSFLKGMDLDNWEEEDVVRLIDRFADSVDNISNTAFREVRVAEEMHTAKIASYPDVYYGSMVAVHLNHSPVRAIQSLKVFEGTEYVEWVGVKTEGRANDYWVDYALGIVYLTTSAFWNYGLEAKVGYTYGETKVDTKAWELNIQYVIRAMLTQLAHVVAVPEGGQNPIENRLAKVEQRIVSLEEDFNGWKIVDEGQCE